MKHIAIIVVLTLTLVLTSLTVGAKPLGLNCDALTDDECSCVAGYVTLAYYDLDTATHIRDKGMSSVIWVLQKAINNCF